MPHPAISLPCPDPCNCAGSTLCAPPSRDLTLTLVWFDAISATGLGAYEDAVTGTCRRRTTKVRLHFASHSAPHVVGYTGDDTGPFGYLPVGYTSTDGRIWASDCVSFPANIVPGLILDELAGIDLDRSLANFLYPAILPVLSWRFVAYTNADGTVDLEGFTYNTDSPDPCPSADPPVPTRKWTAARFGPGLGDSTVGPYGRRWGDGGAFSDKAGLWYAPGTWGVLTCVRSPFLEHFGGAISWIDDLRGETGFLLRDDCKLADHNGSGLSRRASRFFTDLILTTPEIDPLDPCSVCVAVRCCEDDCVDDAGYSIYPAGGESETTFPPDISVTPLAEGSIPVGVEVCFEWPVSGTPVVGTEWFDLVIAGVPDYATARIRIGINKDVCLNHKLIVVDLVKVGWSPTFYVYGAKEGCPVEDAKVTFTDGRATYISFTGVDGICEFTGRPTPRAGNGYTITVEPPDDCIGWATYTRSGTLTAGKICDFGTENIQLQPDSTHTYAGGICTRPLPKTIPLTDSAALGNGGLLAYVGFDSGTSTALWALCSVDGPGLNTIYTPAVCSGSGTHSYDTGVNAAVIGYVLTITGSCDDVDPPTWLLSKTGLTTFQSCGSLTGGPPALYLLDRLWTLSGGVYTAVDVPCAGGIVSRPTGYVGDLGVSEARASGTLDCTCGSTASGSLAAVGSSGTPSGFASGTVGMDFGG